MDRAEAQGPSHPGIRTQTPRGDESHRVHSRPSPRPRPTRGPRRGPRRVISAARLSGSKPRLRTCTSEVRVRNTTRSRIRNEEHRTASVDSLGPVTLADAQTPSGAGSFYSCCRATPGLRPCLAQGHTLTSRRSGARRPRPRPARPPRRDRVQTHGPRWRRGI